MNYFGKQAPPAEVATGLYAPVMSATNEWESAKARGQAWIAGKAVSVPALAGSAPVFRIENPSNSGKKIIVVGLTVYTNVAQQIRYNEGGTLAGPNAITPQNFVRGVTLPAPKAIVQWDDAAATGGNTWDNESRVVNDLKLELGVALLEGSSLLVMGTSAAEQVTTLNCYFIEKPK